MRAETLKAKADSPASGWPPRQRGDETAKFLPECKPKFGRAHDRRRRRLGKIDDCTNTEFGL